MDAMLKFSKVLFILILMQTVARGDEKSDHFNMMSEFEKST
jgi:hypothetical protein